MKHKLRFKGKPKPHCQQIKEPFVISLQSTAGDLYLFLPLEKFLLSVPELGDTSVFKRRFKAVFSLDSAWVVSLSANIRVSIHAILIQLRAGVGSLSGFAKSTSTKGLRALHPSLYTVRTLSKHFTRVSHRTWKL